MNGKKIIFTIHFEIFTNFFSYKNAVIRKPIKLIIDIDSNIYKKKSTGVSS